MSGRRTDARDLGAGMPIDGMAEIFASFGGLPAAPDPTLPASPLPTGGAEVDGGQAAALAALTVQLGALNGNLGAMTGHGRRRRPSIPVEYCHPLDFTPDQRATAGTLDVPDKFGPKTGWIWHITRLSIVGLAGATTLSVFKDSTADPSMQANSVTGTAPVSLIWEPRLLLLLPNRKLVFSGVGGGFTVNGEGVEIAMPWIAEYLM
jgi:hypothetical protein